MKMKESLKGLSNVISRISHNNALTGVNIKQSYTTMHDISRSYMRAKMIRKMIYLEK